jgi:hypothetical protein
MINIAITDDSNVKAKEQKNKQAQRPRDQGQQDVATEDKNCASYNWSIRNN